MNRHQILSGACNAGDRCYAVGSVEGISFTAYAAGCNIVILASNFERVQIIPGAIHNYIRISCLDCSTDTGKIAAAYENQICIFEPTPLIHSTCSHQLEYRWVQTGTLLTDSNITSLSWNLEGTRLLTGGELLQLWHQNIQPFQEEQTKAKTQTEETTTKEAEQNVTGNSSQDPDGVTFSIGGEAESPGPGDSAAANDPGSWSCVWKCRTATPVHLMSFSPDGTLFATTGRDDKLVKIWFENKNLFPMRSMDQLSYCQSLLHDSYSFVYIAHPRAVTHLSWRKTSKYMPKGSVSNMLVTSCRDNICRVWAETIPPEIEGLANMSQFEGSDRHGHHGKHRHHSMHKHRFMQRLKHMKTCFHIRRHAKQQQHQAGHSAPTLPTLPSTYSVHDFHNNYQGFGHYPGMHFHLAASINAETDIPLVPSLITGDPDREPNFILHWLNNKEMYFTMQAEGILQELTRKVVEKEEGLRNNEADHAEHDSEDEHTPSNILSCYGLAHSLEKGPKHQSNKSGVGGRTTSQDEHSSDEHHTAHTGSSHHSLPYSGHSHQSLSNTTSINSIATDATSTINHTPDSLDTKIETLLRDWHHNPDLLFSIHPIDGSFLIWHIEWLDEYHPGSFRQAQISFSTRIPNAFPLGDASTMSHNVSMYSHNTGGPLLSIREVAKSVSKPADHPEVATPLPSLIEQDEDQSTLTSKAGQELLQNVQTFVTSKDNANAGEDATAEAAKQGQDAVNDMLRHPSPMVSMVSKHSNGTLNLWQLTFGDKTKFSQVLSIGHACRASGHRFRVNDITCHPVLPLLVTTSHHNIPEFNPPNPDDAESENIGNHNNQSHSNDLLSATGFCSELILWRVDPVGPLSKSGGVSELARINSLEISAFSNVAWIPTLLPSTTLGNLSNSASACFVASDGQCLRVYQAVIDARTLLAEVSISERKSRMMDSMASLSTDISSDDGVRHSIHDRIKIVSQQSTARPGCIIQLDAISDATHDWQNTQFLHVFQEQLITGERNDEKQPGVDTSANDLGLMESTLDAMVDLQQSAIFEEPFYIVVLERTTKGSTVHMWRLVIASQPETNGLTGSMMYVPDSHLVQDEDEEGTPGRHSEGRRSRRQSQTTGGRSRRSSQADYDSSFAHHHHHHHNSHVLITTTKVCTQELPLPDGVEVVHASPAAGHLSSSSIYPACFAPYIIVTACNDSTVRFWKCKVTKNQDDQLSYEWCEWEMFRKDQESAIDISGTPLNVSAAYSGRIACAYKYGKSFTRPTKADPDSRYVNLCVAIYECESTGGSEWILEDTIHLKNIHLPRIQVDQHLDLSYLYDSRFLQKKQRLNQVLQTLSHEDIRSPRNGDSEAKTTAGLLAVPSFSTLQSLRKSIIENGNTCPLTQKHLVQLDWVSKEDGSHILTVGVGSKIMLFTPVCSDLAQANMKAMKESKNNNRPILRKTSSLAQPQFVDEIRWMKLRKIRLTTADGLPPLPMQISWVRDGILVVGMDSEMHVYSQWKPNPKNECLHSTLQHQESDEFQASRNLRDEDLRTLAQETSQRRLANVSSIPHLSRVSSINLTMLDIKRKRGLQSDTVTFDYMPDYGLFEASRIACPVLPQYHPKQLMELLHCGKIRWVKAILAHLVKCIATTCGAKQDDENYSKQRSGWTRTRTMSVNYTGTSSPLEQRGSTTQIPEEFLLDYAEIVFITPLPLWRLLKADKESSATQTQDEDKQDYNELFDGHIDEEESLDAMLEESYDSSRQMDRRSSIPEKQSGAHFGPREGRQLSQMLTHSHLPGLSSLDQMHLLALADTVSTCDVDFAERFAIDAAKTAIAKENLTGIPDSESVSTNSLDDCGLRFLLAMKHYNYLIRCLPLSQRAQFQKQGVSTNNLVWAFHSETEEELLGLIPSYAKGQPKWSVLKELGVGWWIRSNAVLKTCIEKIAKAAFQQNQDPLDAAIYYLAMKKKNLVWGLFRNKRDERMTSFFANNFTEDRWRKAALKNAYALLGRQRFDHAAAFFLLAGSLRDAIEVCLNKLNDIQLAMVISRLYEDDISSTEFKRLLYEEILGCEEKKTVTDLNRVHPDPFLRSMALWMLKDYSGSLNTLLLTNVGTLHSQYNDESEKPEGATANPNVFNFYVYLRTHPLLIRQYIASTAQDKKKATSVVLSGFSYGTDSNKSQPDKQLTLEDSITPLERQLYFTTAHAHFKAGCPALALEVLSKLPNKVMETNGEDTPSLLNSPNKSRAQNSLIDTGMMSWDAPTQVDKPAESSSAMDWGSSAVDWSQPIIKEPDELELKWDDDEPAEDAESPPMSMDAEKKTEDSKPPNKRADSPKPVGQLDIMAQQLKFVACLKILMEELSTLATGFEVDGGQLRYQLYIWLEREVDALRQLCNYSVNTDGDVSNINEYDGIMGEDVGPYKPGEQLTLHEILLSEKLDFEAKVQRAARRKKWLKANETLLRTMLSYCSLHGASGGGLASVRMELVLLLQELQQEKTQQQLLSPLPFPTTLPLLSASVACNKTVVADPVRHLQSLAYDMLQTLVELRSPPTLSNNGCYYEIFTLRDLTVALSSCIYQSLCDSDTTKNQQPEIFPAIAEVESFSGGHLVASNKITRRYSLDETVTITTPPSKWPGVTNLRALLAREKDEDTPKLNILLCESFVSTYMSLFVYALASCDSHLLFRLVGHHFDNNTWSCLFGGGVKKLVRIASTNRNDSASVVVERTDSISGDIQAAAGGVWNTMTSLTKQRVKLNMKLLGQFTGQTPNIKEDKPTYREQFVSPQMSMVSYFLMKPRIESEYADEIDYDSSDSAVSDLGSSEEEEDVFDTNAKPKSKPKDNTEHLNSNGYSWCVMRLAIVKILKQQLQDFLNVAGIELQELPVSSPLIHAVLGVVAQWEDSLREELDAKGPPPANYILGCTPDPNPSPSKPAIHKYRALLEKENTPFNTRLASAAPVNRLWCYLVRQEAVQDIFIRAVFGKHRSLSAMMENAQSAVDSATRNGSEDKGSDSGTTSLPEPVRIIHKEQDSISAFCLNQVNPGLMALATPREVQEMDISLLLELPSWLEDECEFDIINLNKSVEPEPVQPTSFLVIQTAADRPLLAQNPLPNTPQPQSGIASQSGRGASVILKHKIDGIRRVSAHPLLPLYLTGSQDGSVSLWEWGHQTAVSTPRPAGTFAKVTRVHFSQHGNKFGVADSDGHLSLFQVACREGTARPFFNYQCHSKVTADFVFLGACSLVATAGHGSEGRNVALWDTLLPQNKSLVQGFTCHDQGASSVILAPQHQLLISGGKKGDINIFDVRQRQQRHRFQAHESAIKCLALDPHEEFFVSGAGDGDIKVWALTVHSLLYSFPGEHPRSSFFKNIGQGVTQLHVDSAGRLFSCGADGSMKVRQLPERDCVVHSIY